MPIKCGDFTRILSLSVFLLASFTLSGQTGNAGAVRGTVTDPSGAVIPNATVHMSNAASGLDRSVSTDASGQFVFSNVPFNPYEVAASAPGFSSSNQNVEIRSVVGISLK